MHGQDVGSGDRKLSLIYQSYCFSMFMDRTGSAFTVNGIAGCILLVLSKEQSRDVSSAPGGKVLFHAAHNAFFSYLEFRSMS